MRSGEWGIKERDHSGLCFGMSASGCWIGIHFSHRVLTNFSACITRILMETNVANTNAADAAAITPDVALIQSALERRLDLKVSIAELDKKVEQQLKLLGKNTKMPGFRPGKVPANVIRAKHGSQARQEALTEALGRIFEEAVAAQQLRIAGYPNIEPKMSESTTHIEFSAVFEVYPEITLGALVNVEIERPVLEVSDSEIDNTLLILRKQRSNYEPADRPAAAGDRVTIDFLGKKDGEPFQGGSANDYAFVLNEGAMLPDFENAILGMKAGEAKSFELTFPENYSAKELAGQAVTFDVSVKEVREAILPEIDANFAKALGVESGDIVQMRAEIASNLKREVKKRLHAKVKNQVMDALYKANPIDVPNSLVEMEIQRSMQAARQEAEQRGMKLKDFPMQPEWFANQARRRVSLGLLLSEIVQAHDLHAKSDQVKAIVEESAESYEHPEEVVRWYFAQPQRLAEIESVAVEDNVVTWALANATVVDKAVAFAELMGQQP
jgi:trigger factor